MSNPLLSVRIPPELAAKLPQERGARSRLVVALLREKLLAGETADEVAELRRRVEALERRMGGGNG
jgi:hypothetical protein